MLFAKRTKAYRQLLENNTYCFVNNDFTSLSFNMKNQVTFHYSAHNVTNPRKPLWHKGFGDSSSTEHFTKRLKTAYILLFKRSKIRSKSSRK